MGAALRVQRDKNDLYHGVSHPCPTFGNAEGLSKTDNFIIQATSIE